MNKCYCGNDILSEYSSKYYRCDSCNTLVSKHDFTPDVSQVVSEEKDLYGSNYWMNIMVREAGVKDIDELVDLYIPERATYWLKYCLQYLKPGAKVADVGCGLGQFSYMLKVAGFHPVSFELSPQICQYIKQQLGLQAVCGELCSSDEKYQAIIAMDVFEHLIEPEKFLKDCSQRLETDGILVLQMPCYDPECTYEEMLVRKPHFKNLLVEEQHVFLYSRDAIAKLLKKNGFTFVVFEPAFFGDDYDMFLFASKTSFCTNTSEEINEYLNSIPEGRIIKGIFRLFDEKNQASAKIRAIDNERNKILQDVDKLNQIIKDKEAQVSQFEETARERLTDIYKLTEDNDIIRREADKRLVDIERLTEENKVLQTEADKRLADVERLLSENEILSQAAKERLAIIERMTNV